MKFVNYFQGFHIIAIFENASKYDLSNSKVNTNRVAIFFQERHKEQFLLSSSEDTK